MIHYLQGEEKARSRKLWEEAFPEDSQAFRDYYYTEKTKDNEILVLEEQGKVMSMLHRNPYDLALGKQNGIFSAFISFKARSINCRIYPFLLCSLSVATPTI